MSSTTDKIKGVANEAAGSAKEGVGKAAAFNSRSQARSIPWPRRAVSILPQKMPKSMLNLFI